MAGEREPFATKELRGVKYTENNAATLLEQHLGIVIPEHPKTIVLTPRNRLALYRNPEFRKTKKISLLNVLAKDSIQFGGYYENKSNTCILKRKPQEDTDETPLHEAMHAFIDQANPEIPQFINKIFQNNPTAFYYEAAETYHIFLEGIATWGSWETISHIRGKTSKETRDQIHREGQKILLGITNKRDLSNEDIMRQFALIKERVNIWKTLIDNPKDKELIKKYDNSSKEIVTQTTVYGHYFVHHIMSALTSQGISVSDVLRILALNPPQPPRALDQLQDPVAFADELIVYYIRERRRVPQKN